MGPCMLTSHLSFLSKASSNSRLYFFSDHSRYYRGNKTRLKDAAFEMGCLYCMFHVVIRNIFCRSHLYSNNFLSSFVLFTCGCLYQFLSSLVVRLFNVNTIPAGCSGKFRCFCDHNWEIDVNVSKQLKLLQSFGCGMRFLRQLQGQQLVQ